MAPAICNERLIREVFARPCLWQVKSKDYKDTNKKKTAVGGDRRAHAAGRPNGRYVCFHPWSIQCFVKRVNNCLAFEETRALGLFGVMVCTSTPTRKAFYEATCLCLGQPEFAGWAGDGNCFVA